MLGHRVYLIFVSICVTADVDRTQAFLYVCNSIWQPCSKFSTFLAGCCLLKGGGDIIRYNIDLSIVWDQKQNQSKLNDRKVSLAMGKFLQKIK
jgi:hypothetical protein